MSKKQVFLFSIKHSEHNFFFIRALYSRSMQCKKNGPYASDYFCRLLKNFLAYSLDPDQVRLNVGPDLDPVCLSEINLWKSKLKKKTADDKKAWKFISFNV